MRRNDRDSSTITHWAAPYLHDAIALITPLGEGLQHRSDLLRLQDNSLWVAKRFAASTWLGETTPAHLEFTEQFAALVAKRLGLTYKALEARQSGFLHPLDEGVGLIKPYCPGKMDETLSVGKARILGRGLADIHRLGFTHPNATPLPVIDGVVEQPCAWVQSLIQQCNQYLNYRAEEWVVSHRDLHLHNIIWQSNKAPHLLDWESAGLIHPFVELLGLALNCAGVVERHCHIPRFTATLTGYLKGGRRLPKADKTLWLQGFHSWLLWYAYCQKQGRQQDIKVMVATLDYLRTLFPALMAIYNQFSDCKGDGR